MNFFDNLFGSVARGTFPSNPSVDFIPKDSEGGTIQVKGDTASWLGLRNRSMQRYAYSYCFPLSSVIDRMAEMDTNGVVELLKLGGKGKNDYMKGHWAERMTKLFSKPNPLQTWEQFRGQQNVYKRIHGFCPVLPIIPSGFEASPEEAISMINIPPDLLKPKLTGRIVGEKDITGIVESYSFSILGRIHTFRADQIIMLTDGFMQDEDEGYVLPQSRLVGLDMAISNICKAMEADNVLLTKKGPLGFISHDAAATKDAVVGYMPMEKAEKEELQQALTAYGLTLAQFQYVISRQAVKWNPMSFDVKQLGTKETIVQNEKAICHRYGYPYVLYEETEAVYANGNNAAKSVYQNTIIPNAVKDYKAFEDFFKARENNAKIEVDFSHLPIFQQDEQTAAQAANTWNDALEKEWKNNVITLNQWLEKRGYDSIGEAGDKRIGEMGSSQPLVVTLGVGGTQALTEVIINTAITPDTKRQMLIIVFGLTQDQANKMVPNEEPVDKGIETIDISNLNLE